MGLTLNFIRQVVAPLAAFTVISFILVTGHLPSISSVSSIPIPHWTWTPSKTAPAKASPVKPAPDTAPVVPAHFAKKQAVVHLKNGNFLSCRVLQVSQGKVVVEWNDGLITFARAEIRAIEWGQKLDEPDAGAPAPRKAWTLKDNPVIRLAKGQFIHGRIMRVGPMSLGIREDVANGGYIEYEIPKTRITALVYDTGSSEIGKARHSDLVSRFQMLAEYDKLIQYAREPAHEAVKPKKRKGTPMHKRIPIALGRVAETVENFYTSVSEIEKMITPSPGHS